MMNGQHSSAAGGVMEVRLESFGEVLHANLGAIFCNGEEILVREEEKLLRAQ